MRHTSRDIKAGKGNDSVHSSSRAGKDEVAVSITGTGNKMIVYILIRVLKKMKLLVVKL